MAWKVDPAGVQSVLASVSDESTPIYDALGKVDGEVEGAAVGAQSEMIVNALGEFFTSIKSSITTVSNRIPAAADGAAAATTAIIRGDEQMAITAEQNAQTTAVTGDFSVFGRVGG